ncbi:MAG: chorismate synthase, partial [Clostridia bacterium]|nr:chorismate synthase [Clostridia bacterium]
MKYNHRDLRNVLERASARETAARVAVGAICEQLLKQFSIELYTRTVSIGNVYDDILDVCIEDFEKAMQSPVGFCNDESEKEAIEHIETAKKNGESLGGIAETIAINVPPGLGSYVHYDRKLDANIAFSAMSIQAAKGVEIGLGFGCADEYGSSVHDMIYHDKEYFRATNNAGGIEGGMSNGEPIVVRAAMKPIPTLYSPLDTVDINTKEKLKASVERSDVCAVYAFSIVLKSVVGFEIAKAFLEKFGGDCIEDITSSYNSYMERILNF